MKNTIIVVLSYIEYIIPIGFMLFTHFVDEKIHKHWINANYHPVSWIRAINRYQWELCFLTISLFLIFGIKVIHQEKYFEMGILLLVLSICFVVYLIVIALAALHKEDQKMQVSPFYLAIFVFYTYIILDLYLFKIEMNVIPIFSIPKESIFLIGLILFLVTYFILRKIIKAHTYGAEIGELDESISVYKNERISKVKRSEALYYILKHFKETRNLPKLNEWIEIGTKDFPNKTQRLKEYLKL